jgi:hypothetical protein
VTYEQQLDLYLRARCALIVLVTPEEERALHIVRAVCGGKRACLTWDAAEGFIPLTVGVAAPQVRGPLAALEQIDRMEGEMLVVLKDFHDCWGDVQIKRKLRDLVQRLKYSRKSVIVITPAAKVPEELKDEAVLMPLGPPNAAELEIVLDRLTRTPGVRVELSPQGREKLIQAALGLTAAQAQRVFAKAIVADGVLDDGDIGMVTEEKRQVIRESEALEFFPATLALSDVGGLEELKSWLRLRERAFTREAQEYGLPAPKGIALIGIPGTGKSLVAKMIGGLWRLPLFRLDAGALFGSFVGESEERTRRALRLAETAAPALLWIDEVEKALAHGGLDSGTSTLAVHLRKRRRCPEAFDVDRLGRESEGYTGAELEQAIIDAMYVAFSDGREFTTEDVSLSLQKQVPLSVSQRETIGALRAWLSEGRAQSASSGRRDSNQGVGPPTSS